MASSLCGSRTYPILVVLLTNFALASLICIQGLSTMGYTFPEGDIVIEYGTKPLEITCVVNDSSLENPSKYLVFLKNSVVANATIINDTSIRLYEEHVPKSAHTYYCVFRKKPNPQVIVCLNRVIVGTKPLSVTDFQCISQNYDNLTCTWTAPENYVDTTYDLKYTFKGRAGRLTPNSCPAITTDHNKKSCFWNVSTEPHYRQSQPTYNFVLTMNNTFGINSLNYVFDHFKFVKPGPPENLSAINATTNSILLRWNIPNTMETFSPGLNYRIIYQCTFGPKDWKLAAIEYVQPKSPPFENEREIFYNLSGLLHAHDLCDIRVSLRSNKSTDENMWSSNASITHGTSSTVPGAPPAVNLGSFQLDKTKNMLTRDVYIYWQQIPDEIKNGEDFNYDVKADNNSGLGEGVILDAYAKFENLLISKEYTFKIWSNNSEGLSVSNSVITVPAVKDRPREVQSFTKIAYKNGTFKLFYDIAIDNYNNIPIKNFTIFWCKNSKDRPYQCNGRLNWTEVPSNTTSYEVAVSETNDSVYQFAISVNSENYSSGMVWAACTLLHSQAIGRIKQVFKVVGRSDSIQLGWKLDCIDGISSINGFIVYFCPIVSPAEKNCKEPQQNVTIKGDSTTISGNVTGLTPYTTYMLTVAIQTENGDISEPSDNVLETTLESAPTQPQNLIVLETTNSSIKISWEPPEERNGALKYYEVHYNDLTDIVELVDKSEVSEMEYELKNLSSFRDYNISVVACTTACSEPLIEYNVTTKMGIPEKISQPRVFFQNDSFILVDWNKPNPARGRNDYYEVRLQEKRLKSNEVPRKINVTTTQCPIVECGKEGKVNTLIVSVRAVNIIDSDHLPGPWSDELECYCSNPPNILFWVSLGCVFIVLLSLMFIIKRMFMYCKVMKNVELKLPPGLVPIPDWGTSKGLEEPEHMPSVDEELLLVKMSENRLPSGDSSGCCSGHGSVSSDSGTTISGSSDSYVIAGTKSPIDVMKTKSEDKPLYVQFSDAKLSENRLPSNDSSGCCSDSSGGCSGLVPETAMNTPYSYVMAGPKNSIMTKGYVSIGEMPANRRPIDTKKGYVPHRHFGTKLLKED